jgi:transposase
MTKPLSMDIRERAMARLDAGKTVRRIAEAPSVAPSSVVKWSERRRATGSAAPGKIGGHVPRKIRGEHEVWLRARMADGAFRLRGLVAELAERGLKVDYRTMWAFAHAEGLSFKKNALASEQERPDVARKRARWKARQGSIDPKRLVFIDETRAKTNMARCVARRCAFERDPVLRHRPCPPSRGRMDPPLQHRAAPFGTRLLGPGGLCRPTHRNERSAPHT